MHGWALHVRPGRVRARASKTVCIGDFGPHLRSAFCVCNASNVSFLMIFEG